MDQAASTTAKPAKSDGVNTRRVLRGAGDAAGRDAAAAFGDDDGRDPEAAFDADDGRDSAGGDAVGPDPGAGSGGGFFAGGAAATGSAARASGRGGGPEARPGADDAAWVC